MLILGGPGAHEGHEEAGHPERPERVTAVLAGVGDLDLAGDLVHATPREATRAELLRVHDGAYLDELGAFCYGGGGDIDEDTYATYDSYTIARATAGSGLAVVDELRRRDAGVGLVVTRPPGHHAMTGRAMGFCLLNNVAIAAAHLAAAGERVAVIDFDVHHGNGTQEIFWNDPRVLYVSSHQVPLFPGSGMAGEVGGPDALGATCNLPLPAGATGDVVSQAYDDIAGPVIDRFAPTWVLVSAGYDAHRSDPLADLALTSGDFAALARFAGQFAPAGRLAFFLEGGYNLQALRSSITATLASALGDNRADEAPSSGGPGHEVVTRDAALRAAALERAGNETRDTP
jgi:acetoin utilization deacetylase AcuC-like enzyme